MEPLSVSERGEMCVSLNLTRHSRGTRVKVWAQPRVEALFASWADNRTSDPLAHGRHWTPLDTTPLVCYRAPVESYPTTTRYTLMDIGQPLVAVVEDDEDPRGRPKDRANLAILRLKGISEPGGITFLIPGIHSTEYMRQMLRLMETGIRAFYQDYLLPVNLALELKTSEIQR
jgi:hypothetical protein